LHDLNIPNLDRHTRLEIDSNYTCQYKSATDSSSGTCYPSLGHYIKKMMLVSDNEAYNRVYEFLSPELINDRLDSLGMPTARIWHRFLWCDNESNKYTNPFTFYNDSGQVIYKQPMMYCTKTYDNPIGEVKLGSGHYDFNNNYFNYSKDFSDRNYMSLSQINSFVKMVAFPEVFPSSRVLRLDHEDLRFMRKYMSMFATE
jgi:hypothetical protein